MTTVILYRNRNEDANDDLNLLYKIGVVCFFRDMKYSIEEDDDEGFILFNKEPQSLVTWGREGKDKNLFTIIAATGDEATQLHDDLARLSAENGYVSMLEEYRRREITDKNSIR